MTEENIDNKFKIESKKEIDFILFLILILLLMGNGRSFNTYFELLNSEINQVDQILKAFSTTADALKNVFEASQKTSNDT